MGKCRIIDFCAYQARAEAEAEARPEPTVRELARGIEQELALGSEFYLVAWDRTKFTPLRDPVAIAVAIIKTSARPECGTVAIEPAPERRHIFKGLEGWEEDG